MSVEEYIKGKRLCNLLAYAFKDIRLNDYRLMLEAGHKIDLPYKEWREAMLEELEMRKQAKANKELGRSIYAYRRRRKLVRLTFQRLTRKDFKLAKAFDKAAGKMTFEEWRDMMYQLQRDAGKGNFKRGDKCS